MVSIRRAQVEDMAKMQQTNVWCLPENYTSKYYFYHWLNWNQLLYVAEEVSTGKIVGYVLAKVDEDTSDISGHITSISVLRTHRKLGIAYKLMCAAHIDMVEVMDCDYCSLNVRVTNRAALNLYEGKLGYLKTGIEEGYYADGEDGYIMKKFFKDTDEKQKILKQIAEGKIIKAKNKLPDRIEIKMTADDHNIGDDAAEDEKKTEDPDQKIDPNSEPQTSIPTTTTTTTTESTAPKKKKKRRM